MVARLRRPTSRVSTIGVAKLIQTVCPECQADVELEDDAVIGEITPCVECGLELEVTGIDPLTVAPAPEIEEDWGE